MGMVDCGPKHWHEDADNQSERCIDRSVTAPTARRPRESGTEATVSHTNCQATCSAGMTPVVRRCFSPRNLRKGINSKYGGSRKALDGKCAVEAVEPDGGDLRDTEFHRCQERRLRIVACVAAPV